MVLRLTSRSPRRSGLFVTVVCASSRRLDAGVEASEPHDFAVRVSTIRPSRAARVHRIPHPTSVTIAKRPSVWDGMIRSIPVSTKRQSEKFLREGLDSQFAKQPVGQITHHPAAQGDLPQGAARSQGPRGRPRPARSATVQVRYFGGPANRTASNPGPVLLRAR
jgi:hypothetical protein